MRALLLTLISLTLLSCSGVFRPAMSDVAVEPVLVVETGVQRASDISDENSSDLFSSASSINEPFHFEETADITVDSTEPPGFKDLKAPLVRIALKQNVYQLALHANARVVVTSSYKRVKLKEGEVIFQFAQGKVRLQAHGKEVKLQLPCTLHVVNENSWEFDRRDYAEKAVLVAGSKKGITLLNVLTVESYLRGVVPLEIGTRSEKELEALKAQAVAARTYTYQRMEKRKERTYDLLPTVADQVYGGVGVASPFTDSAILSTVGEVMVDSTQAFIGAFYHSTCGGHTAGIAVVWNSRFSSYVQGAPDRAPNGTPWCASSSKLHWTEEWTIEELSSILRTYSQESKLTPFQGTIKKIKVTRRGKSGRILACQVTSNRGTYTYGKDKIRFVFRRNSVGYPILWSANFRIEIVGNRVVAKGVGFGHGIGMCQVGALGRARAGQSYRTILQAYYHGSLLERVAVKDEQ